MVSTTTTQKIKTIHKGLGDSAPTVRCRTLSNNKKKKQTKWPKTLCKMTAKKHSPQPHCHFPRPYETQPATSRPPSCEEKGGGRRPPHLMRLKEVAAAAPQDPRLLRGRHSGLSLPPNVHTPRARPGPAHPMTVPAPLAAAPPRMLQRVSQSLQTALAPPLHSLGRSSAPPSRWSLGPPSSLKKKPVFLCLDFSSLSPWPSDFEQ